MRLILPCLLILGLALLLPAVSRGAPEATEGAADAKIIHEVFFTLNDHSADARRKVVDACKKYLTKHPGEVHFAVGTRASDFARPVNDRDFDVSLTIVFKNKAAHDKYNGSARHQEFIKENKDNWKKVRVFDSELAE